MARANRAINLSGVSADKVEEQVTVYYDPITTPLFLKWGILTRPMAQPPFVMNGAGELHSLDPHTIPTPAAQPAAVPPPPPRAPPPAARPAARRDGDDDDDDDDHGGEEEGEEAEVGGGADFGPMEDAFERAEREASEFLRQGQAGATPDPLRRQPPPSGPPSTGPPSTSTSSTSSGTPLHVGGEQCGSSAPRGSRVDKTAAMVQTLVMQQQAASRAMMRDLAEQAEKTRCAERAHELEMVKTAAGSCNQM